MINYIKEVRKTSYLLVFLIMLSLLLVVFIYHDKNIHVFAESDIAIGDLNDDGNVGVIDAIKILRYITGLQTLTPEQKVRADVSNNGRIDINDAILILRKTVGLINKLPIESIENFSVHKLNSATIDKITGVSYKENDKVGIDDLRLVKVLYFGFDRNIHQGELIVHKKLANEVKEIFRELLEAKFSIEQIRLIDEFNACDDLSMKNNNTSALCVRLLTGSNHRMSPHSYGIAIDINPVQNPYVKGDIVLPPNAIDYVDRTRSNPHRYGKGVITKGSACYNAFKSRGWIWGGDWISPKDYMHFEKRISL